MKTMTGDDFQRAKDASYVEAQIEFDLDEFKRLQQLKPQEFIDQIASVVNELVQDNLLNMVKFGAIKLPLEPVRGYITLPRNTYADYTEDEDGYFHGVGEPTGSVPAKLSLYWSLQVAQKEAP